MRQRFFLHMDLTVALRRGLLERILFQNAFGLRITHISWLFNRVKSKEKEKVPFFSLIYRVANQRYHVLVG